MTQRERSGDAAANSLRSEPVQIQGQRANQIVRGIQFILARLGPAAQVGQDRSLQCLARSAAVLEEWPPPNRPIAASRRPRGAGSAPSSPAECRGGRSLAVFLTPHSSVPASLQVGSIARIGSVVPAKRQDISHRFHQTDTKLQYPDITCVEANKMQLTFPRAPSRVLSRAAESRGRHSLNIHRDESHLDSVSRPR